MGRQQNKECLTQVEFPVEIETDVVHKHRCDYKGGNNKSYIDVDLEFDLEPKICVEKLKHDTKQKGCFKKCSYRIYIENQCTPRVITSKPNQCKEKHNVVIDLETNAYCKPGAHVIKKRDWNNCRKSSSSSSSCSSSSSSSSYSKSCGDCKTNRKCRKHRKQSTSRGW